MARSSVKATLVRQHLIREIGAGNIKAGERLPSERELARTLSMNALTVRRGLEQLVAEGIILKQPRVGNFINPDFHPGEATQIAVCLPHDYEDLPHVSISQIYTSGLQQGLPANEYGINVLHYDRDDFHRQAIRRALLQKCRAIVTSRGGMVTEEEIDELEGRNVAIISIGRPVNPLANRIRWVGIDEQAVWAELVSGLCRRGHENILIARYTHAHSLRIGHTQLQHVFSSTQKLEQTVRFLDVPNPGKAFDITPLEEALLELRPRTAVIVPDEMIAAAVLRFSLKNRLSVPDDYSLASMQNFIPSLHAVPLTSLDTAKIQLRLCRHAGALIDQLCKGESPEALGTTLPAQINWTESVKDWTAPTV